MSILLSAKFLQQLQYLNQFLRFRQKPKENAATYGNLFVKIQCINFILRIQLLVSI